MMEEEMVITLVIKAKATIIPGRSQNYLHMSEAANYATVSEDGKELGEVGGTFGAGYEIKDKETGITWFIKAEDFWNAFIEAKDK